MHLIIRALIIPGMDLLYGLEIPEPGPIAQLPEIMVEDDVMAADPSPVEETQTEITASTGYDNVPSNAQTELDADRKLSDNGFVSPTEPEPEIGSTPGDVEDNDSCKPIGPEASMITNIDQEIVPPQVEAIVNVNAIPPENGLLDEQLQSEKKSPLNTTNENILEPYVHLNAAAFKDEKQAPLDTETYVSDDLTPHDRNANISDEHITLDVKTRSVVDVKTGSVDISSKDTSIFEEKPSDDINRTQPDHMLAENGDTTTEACPDHIAICPPPPPAPPAPPPVTCGITEPQEHPVELTVCKDSVTNNVEDTNQIQSGVSLQTGVDREHFASIGSDLTEAKSLPDSMAIDVSNGLHADSDMEIVSEVMEKTVISEELCEKPESGTPPVCDSSPHNVYNIFHKPARGPYLFENFALQDNEHISGNVIKHTESPNTSGDVTSLESETSELDSENTSDDVKVPEQHDTEPLLNENEQSTDSKAEIVNVQRGECDSFLSRIMDWACSIL